MSNESKLMEFEKEFGLVVNDEGKVVVSSRTVALKYKKEHKHVMRDIRNLIEDVPEAQSNFGLSDYINENNREMPEYLMDRQGFSMLVLGFNGKEAKVFTYKYTKAFEEMIEELEHRRQVSLDVVKALNVKDDKLQRKQLLESHFGKRKTVTTFKTCSYEEFTNLLSLFEEYILQIRDADIKRIEYNRLIDGLTQNRNSIPPTDKMYMPKTSTYSYYIHEFTRKKGSSENKSYGQRLRYKEEIIKDQQIKLSILNPSIDEYMCINVHGLSNNKLYETVKNNYTGKDIVVKTYQYKKWLEEFPYDQLIPKEELNVDWDRPIMLFYKFDCITLLINKKSVFLC